jgi:hypothetical protein
MSCGFKRLITVLFQCGCLLWCHSISLIFRIFAHETCDISAIRLWSLQILLLRPLCLVTMEGAFYLWQISMETMSILWSQVDERAKKSTTVQGNEYFYIIIFWKHCHWNYLAWYATNFFEAYADTQGSLILQQTCTLATRPNSPSRVIANACPLCPSLFDHLTERCL